VEWWTMNGPSALQLQLPYRPANYMLPVEGSERTSTHFPFNNPTDLATAWKMLPLAHSTAPLGRGCSTETTQVFTLIWYLCNSPGRSLLWIACHCPPWFSHGNTEMTCDVPPEELPYILGSNWCQRFHIHPLWNIFNRNHCKLKVTGSSRQRAEDISMKEFSDRNC
jgi:hypothetical protein